MITLLILLFVLGLVLKIVGAALGLSFKVIKLILKIVGALFVPICIVGFIMFGLGFLAWPLGFQEKEDRPLDFRYETPRLILRVLEPKDAEDVLQFYMEDKEIFEKFEGAHNDQFYTIEYQKENLRAEYNLAYKLMHLRYYVFLKEDPDHIIGTICFHNIVQAPYSSCEVGYKFSSAYHHQGYAAEALEKLIDAVFTDMKLHRVMAWVVPENIPSIRLLEGLGFQYEGISRDHAMLSGKWTDHGQYSMLSPL